MGDWVLEQKSDRTVPLGSTSISFQNTAGATDIRDMDSVIAKLQQIAMKINRYVEKASRDIVRSRVVGCTMKCTNKLYMLSSPENPKEV